ncbi:MAG: hypothetical protein IPM60_07475 [Rhodospirillales bacterium]|nr:hypothetical protein [Rhodospirillales bacterium]
MRRSTVCFQRSCTTGAGQRTGRSIALVVQVPSLRATPVRPCKNSRARQARSVACSRGRTGAVAAALHYRTYEDHWTPVHLDIVVDDLEAAAERALAAGARASGPARERNWGRFAPMRDPFGHGFCLIEFRGSDYDLAEIVTNASQSRSILSFERRKQETSTDFKG